MTTDDRQLLIRAHRGEEASARALWDRHAGRLTRFARSILRSPADADDVVQAVFIGVLRLPASRVRGVEDAAAWLALLTRRHALNHVRSARRRRQHEDAGTLRVRGSRSPTGRSGEPSPDPDLSAALDALPRRLREVIVLKHICGLTFDQIALALALNRNTAASRYRAAMDALRRALGVGSTEADPAEVRKNGTGRSSSSAHAFASEVPHE